jgi:hypothetical protein
MLSARGSYDQNQGQPCDRSAAFESCLKGRELERVKGIEPSYSAWKAAALPLSYTRVSTIGLVVGEVGLEPTKA